MRRGLEGATETIKFSPIEPTGNMCIIGKNQLTELIKSYNWNAPLSRTPEPHLPRSRLHPPQLCRPPNRQEQIRPDGTLLPQRGKSAQRLRRKTRLRTRKPKQRETAHHHQTRRPVDAYRVREERRRSLALQRELYVPVHERRRDLRLCRNPHARFQDSIPQRRSAKGCETTSRGRPISLACDLIQHPAQLGILYLPSSELKKALHPSSSNPPSNSSCLKCHLELIQFVHQQRLLCA